MSDDGSRDWFPVSRHARSSRAAPRRLLQRSSFQGKRSLRRPELARWASSTRSVPGGIDLVLERKELLVGGRVGQAIAINGSIPGPVIRMKEGKDVLIRVHNRLDESTSIHWHGLIVPFTMDGVPGISFGHSPR